MPHKISGSQQIVKDIQNKILNKFYKPGEKLPTERQLAEIYGISRTSVREALKKLAQIGIVVTKQGSGNYIKSIDTSSVVETLLQYFYMNGATITEFFKLRKMLEVQVAREAAHKRTAAELKNIRKYARLCANEISAMLNHQKHSYTKTDRMFHVAIAEASHNKLLRNFVEIVQKTFAMQHKLFKRTDNELNEIIRQHSVMLNAIEDGDADAAAKAVEEHMDYIYGMMEAGLVKLGRWYVFTPDEEDKN